MSMLGSRRAGVGALKPGDHVEVYRDRDEVERWLPGKIIDITGDFVTVFFEEHGTPYRKNLHVHSTRLKISFPVLVPEPERRGMTAEQFEKFFKKHCGRVTYEAGDELHLKPICLPVELATRCIEGNVDDPNRKYPYEPNLHAVNDFFIKPHTDLTGRTRKWPIPSATLQDHPFYFAVLEGKISYAELLNPDGRQIDYFISHHWGEDFAEFIQSLLRHARSAAAQLGKAWQEVVYWCCAFANNQHMVNLGAELEDSPFHKALASPGCKGTVLNLNRMASALFRVWCVYEAHLTHKLGKEFVVNTCQGPISQMTPQQSSKEQDLWIILVFELLQEVDVGSAAATNEDDKRKIMRAVKKTRSKDGEVGAKALNKMLQAAVAQQAMCVLARLGEAELLKKAMQLGARPDAPDANGVFPLTYAVGLRGESDEAAQELLLGGADPMAKEFAADVLAMFASDLHSKEQAIQRLRQQLPRLPIHRDAVDAAQKSYNAAAVAHWASLLKYRDAKIRVHAAEALGELGAHAAAAVPALEAALQDQVGHVRESAAEALGQLGEHAAAAVPALFKAALQDEDKKVRAHAAEALGQLGEHAAAAVPALEAALQDRDMRVRFDAAEALGQLGEHAAAAVPALVKAALQDEYGKVRAHAAWALGKLGEHAAAAVPALEAALQDEDGKVRAHAAEALSKLGEHAAADVPALVKAALQDQVRHVRESAAWALGKLGEHAAAAVPALVKAALQDEDKKVRARAAWALGQLGEHAAAAVPALVKAALQDTCWYVRLRAAEALGKLGEHAAAVPALVKAALQDEDGHVREPCS